MFHLQPEVFVAAYAAYGLIVMGVLAWNAYERRRSGRRDEPGPGGHVLHERGTQPLVGQVFGRHR